MKKTIILLLIGILSLIFYNNAFAVKCGSDYSILHLTEEEKNNTDPINFPNTYKHFEYKTLANDSKDKAIFEYIGAASREERGSGECSQLSYNMSLALIEVFKQIHYDTIKYIEPSGIYDTNLVNRIIVSDMGGCTEAHAKNFHASFKYTDFLYFNTTPIPELRSRLYTDILGNRTKAKVYEEVYNIVYKNGEIKLIENNFDRIRQALFWKYLQDLNLGGGLVGSQIVEFVQQKLDCIDCSEKEKDLLTKLGIYKYKIEYNPKGRRLIAKNDIRGHPTHMHAAFFWRIDRDEFKRPYWYFYDEEYCNYYNNRESDSDKDKCELIGGEYGKNYNGWCVSKDAEVPLGNKIDSCIDCKKTGKGGSPFFTKVENTQRKKSNDIFTWAKCFTDRRVRTDGDLYKSECREGVIAPWLDKSNKETIGKFESISCSNGKLNVVGWVYDPDEPEKNIDISIREITIMSTPMGIISSPIGKCVANISRDDVNENLGITGNHGFDCSIDDISKGNYNIIIYAIDSTSYVAKSLKPEYKTIECGNTKIKDKIGFYNTKSYSFEDVDQVKGDFKFSEITAEGFKFSWNEVNGAKQYYILLKEKINGRLIINGINEGYICKSGVCMYDTRNGTYEDRTFKTGKTYELIVQAVAVANDYDTEVMKEIKTIFIVDKEKNQDTNQSNKELPLELQQYQERINIIVDSLKDFYDENISKYEKMVLDLKQYQTKIDLTTKKGQQLNTLLNYMVKQIEKTYLNNK